MSDAQYPIGKFSPPAAITAADRAGWIERLTTAPERMRAAAEALTAAQLRMAYRPGGWTARQVIHHVPDSHMNGYIRFKLGLTEDNPVIQSPMTRKRGHCSATRSGRPSRRRWLCWPLSMSVGWW